MNGLEAVGFVVFGGILGGILGFAMARRQRQYTVEAENFVVRDATGKRRAKFGMSQDGGVRLRVFDQDGVCCGSLGVTPQDCACLHLHDRQGVLRAGLGVFPEEAGVGAVFNDQAGHPRLTVSVLGTGAADVRVLDEEGKVLWKTR